MNYLSIHSTVNVEYDTVNSRPIKNRIFSGGDDDRGDWRREKTEVFNNYKTNEQRRKKIIEKSKCSINIFVVSTNRKRAALTHCQAYLLLWFSVFFFFHLRCFQRSSLSLSLKTQYTRIYYYYYVLYCFIINLWHRSLATLSSIHFICFFFHRLGFGMGQPGATGLEENDNMQERTQTLA